MQEELIMPSDYLTTAMVVATAEGDTLVFLDMGGFESLVGLEIPVSYSLQQGDQLLVCFDCTTHQGPIPLYDLTALPSEVEFARLQLEKYLPDPYINPAATYQMRREDGTLGDYYSNVENLIADSTRMASGFFSYGVVTKWHPQLRNREVLEQLLNDEID
ncbi:hypothetical protein [Catalinimonas alkaloidigena]|uniref:hypothetical protein n=1 Tax=Catalinimonas alkaloidigena TaxID=1075417 RepID=UPI000B7C62AC|nr:hypothetical protein [Catalinimonas alkaloidigena]